MSKFIGKHPFTIRLDNGSDLTVDGDPVVSPPGYECLQLFVYRNKAGMFVLSEAQTGLRIWKDKDGMKFDALVDAIPKFLELRGATPKLARENLKKLLAETKKCNVFSKREWALLLEESK